MDMYSSKTPSLYTRRSYMESHQAGYVINPTYVYDDQNLVSVSRSQSSNTGTDRSGTYHSIEDFRSIEFKQKSTQKRTVIIVILALVFVAIIATVVTISVVLSRDDDKKEGPTTQQVSFQGEGTLTGKVWYPDYLDENSELYRSTATEFINKVTSQFSESGLRNNYQSTTVNGYREGSVVILFTIIMITDVSQTQITTNNIINVMVLVPEVTDVTVVEMGQSSSTTTSTTTSGTTTGLSTTPSANTTSTTTATTTTTTTKVPTTSTTSSTKSPTTTTTKTTPAPTTTLLPTTAISATSLSSKSTVMTTTSSTTPTTTLSTTTTTSTTMPTTTMPTTPTSTTMPTTTTPTTTTSTTMPTTTTPTTSHTTSTTTSTSTSTPVHTTSTTTAMTTSTQAPTTFTTTITTTSTAVTTANVPTTTSIIPVCVTGFTGYKVLLEYKKDFMQIYLDITSPTTVSLKLELEAWGSNLLGSFGVDDEISVFAVTDFGPPKTNSSYTLVTVHVCVESTQNIVTISALLGIYIGLLPDYNNVGFSDLFDAKLRYTSPFDGAMTDVTSAEFINVANSVQADGDDIISAVANINSDISILAFYVNRLEPDEDENNTIVTVRIATSFTSGVTELDLTAALNEALLDNSDLSVISVHQIL